MNAALRSQPVAAGVRLFAQQALVDQPVQRTRRNTVPASPTPNCAGNRSPSPRRAAEADHHKIFHRFLAGHRRAVSSARQSAARRIDVRLHALDVHVADALRVSVGARAQP